MSCLPCVPGRPDPHQRVQLNVGGTVFCTTRTTLTRYPGSLFDEVLRSRPGRDDTYFIDRDASRFRDVLNFLRDGPDAFEMDTGQKKQELRSEAKFFKLEQLMALIDKHESDVFTDTLQQKIQKFGDAISGQPPSGGGSYFGAAVPSNEEDRMKRLNGLGILNDVTSREHRYDALTKAVAAVLDVPICLLSLVAEERQCFKSKVGLGADSTDRSSSFCAFTFKPEDPNKASLLIVEDATRDHRFIENPLVKGEPFIRFYAGCPLILSDGLRMGALCAIDQRPRALSSTRAQLLVNFGTLTVREMERAQLEEKAQDSSYDEDAKLGVGDFAAGALRVTRMREALDETVLLVWACWDSLEWPIIYANDMWTNLTGLTVTPPSRLPGFATVEGDVVCPEGKNPGLLWTWLRLKDPSPEYVSLMWKNVRGVGLGAQDSASKGMNANSFTVPTMLSMNGKAISCRFTPADMPLDVCASAVHAPNSGESSLTDAIKGWSPGRLMFVTAVASAPVEKEPKANDAAPTWNSETARIGSGSKEAQKPKRGNEIEALGAMKPPKQPFEDVRLLSKVGEGSFGKVYFGLWSGAVVAVKVIETPYSNKVDNYSPPFEAALAASISHPNLVQTYKSSTRVKSSTPESVEPDTVETWIVQEWCELGTLDQRCEKDREKVLSVGGLSRPLMLEAIEAAMEIAEAGFYLHSRGIIHGDLTANNVLLKNSMARKGFVCKVCDFGLARVLANEQTEVLTNSLGTVTHMPPELFGVVAGGASLTSKADVYSLGIIFWQLVTKTKPFAGQSAPQVVVKVAKGKRPIFPEGVPVELMNMYKAMVEANPVARLDFEQVKKALMKIHKTEQAGGSVDDIFLLS